MARYALKDLLGAIGLSQGSIILLPAFICSDLPDFIEEMGYSVEWYDVDSKLQPIDCFDWPEAKVVLAVNYFGFPQDLSKFFEYARNFGAWIIEDNSHGFLSRDSEGCLLGLRSHAGIFSLRKTFSWPGGAMLAARDKEIVAKLEFQKPFSKYGVGKLSFFKYLFVTYFPWPCGNRVLLRIYRIVRQSFARTFGDILNVNEGRVISHDPRPWRKIPENLLRINFELEIQRRRSLYAHFEAVARSNGTRSVFEGLAEAVVPYGFPFYIDHQGDFELMKLASEKKGLDCICWPDLPEAILNRVKNSGLFLYDKVGLVNFLK